ncbi:hypothetical protein [Vibrio cholerae]|uniref:hypothetical protein n=1 Tax=Vibrio cholerae TaxID=666 RepID=UPI000E650B30|nr:hypothetical protein [Vibrio cholerae]TQP55302.1 hypothetical protein FLL95_17575 [Vibrio cholerae]
MPKYKPNGYVAVCQCGVTVGAIDLNRTDRKESGRILGRWIADGCELKPQFAGTWQANISSCQCEDN